MIHDMQLNNINPFYKNNLQHFLLTVHTSYDKQYISILCTNLSNYISSIWSQDDKRHGIICEIVFVSVSVHVSKQMMVKVHVSFFPYFLG